MTMAYVQHAVSTGSDGGGGITFGSTPTVGNLIVMFIVSGTTGTYTNNANGWTEYANHETGLDLNMSVNYRTVQSGDGVTYAQALTGANISSGRSTSWGYEISGVTSFTSQVETLFMETMTAGLSSNTATSQTPANSTDLMMCVGGEFHNVFPGAPSQTTTGWTTDSIEGAAFNLNGLSAHVTSVTGGVPHALTITWATVPTDGVFATLILKLPSSGETSTITTVLGGVSQHFSAVVGPAESAVITTHLGGISQHFAVTVPQEYATIITTLGGISQTLHGLVPDETGVILTSLPGISQRIIVNDLSVIATIRQFWTFGG